MSESPHSYRKLPRRAPLRTHPGADRSRNSGVTKRYRDRSPQHPFNANDDSGYSGARISSAHSRNITPSFVKPPYYRHWGIIQIGISTALWLALIASVKLVVASI